MLKVSLLYFLKYSSFRKKNKQAMKQAQRHFTSRQVGGVCLYSARITYGTLETSPHLPWPRLPHLFRKSHRNIPTQMY